jgi:glycosyltransferase involved in cell wall biosynthesis
LIYDAQEIESGVRSSANWPPWFWLWFERTLAQRAARVLVTDDFRCAITTALLRLDPARVTVLMSLPRLASLRQSARGLRADCGWLDGRLIVYFGAIMPGRHFEEAIDALRILPAAYRLVLVGFGDPGYVDTLRQRGQQAQLGTRLAILPPVHWSELPDYIGGADCAYVLYRQDSLNNYYCSPSKLFDALVGGVPVVGTDNPLIRRTIKECDAGLCVTSVTPDSLAQAVRTLTERDDLAAMKTRLRVEARVRYSWEQQEQRLLDLYAATVAP